MQGEVLPDGWRNEEVKEALDLCLSCKACKTECPVNVDMATWKAEFLAHHYEGRRHPLYHYAFGFMDKWARLASFAPAVANLGGKLPGVKKLLGIAGARTLPRFAARSFRAEYERKDRTQRSRTDGAQGREERRVLLWADTWNNYFHPQALHAAAKVLESAGKSVSVPRKHVCCGRPLYDFGFLDEARKYLSGILDMFEAEIVAGVPVVMLEPSCASVFKDELLNFFPNDVRAQKLARQTVMLSEAVAGFVPPRMEGRRIVVHGHCHQKALMTMKDEVALLKATGARVEALDSGCCGMAGPFGFEADKLEVSQTLAERVLLPAVRGCSGDDLIVSNGFSCREMVGQNSERRAVHLAEVLAGWV
jgi:Fe-S oxidoreductase